MAQTRSYVCDFTGESFAEGTPGAAHAVVTVNVPKDDGSGIVERKFSMDLSPQAVADNLPEKLDEIRGGRPTRDMRATVAVGAENGNGDAPKVDAPKAGAKA